MAKKTQFLMGGMLTSEQDLDRALAKRPTLISTGTRSTSTPAKSDETPREAPFGGAFGGGDRRQVKAAETPGNTGAKGGDRKVSSPELASLAAKYVNIHVGALVAMQPVAAEQVAAEVRSLAASVLSQAEGDTTK